MTFPVYIMFLLSANNTDFKIVDHKSLIDKTYHLCPKTNPCGKPHVIYLQVDTVSQTYIIFPVFYSIKQIRLNLLKAIFFHFFFNNKGGLFWFNVSNTSSPQRFPCHGMHLFIDTGY